MTSLYIETCIRKNPKYAFYLSANRSAKLEGCAPLLIGNPIPQDKPDCATV